MALRGEPNGAMMPKKKEKRLKPRNPLVAEAMFKKGWTEKSSKAQRRDDKMMLKSGKSYLKDFFQVILGMPVIA